MNIIAVVGLVFDGLDDGLDEGGIRRQWSSIICGVCRFLVDISLKVVVVTAYRHVIVFFHFPCKLYVGIQFVEVIVERVHFIFVLLASVNV